MKKTMEYSLAAPHEDEIHDWVGPSSFQRAHEYVKRRAISEGRVQGNTLKARCLGSQNERYFVWVTLSNGAIQQGSCTCAVGASGRCKHVAALLLTYREQPSDFLVVELIENTLKSADKSTLITLIQQMIAIHPELEAVVERETRPPSSKNSKHIQAYRRKIDELFAYPYFGGSMYDPIPEDLLSLVRTAKARLAIEDYEEAFAIYEAILTNGLNNYEEFSDERGRFNEELANCIDGLIAILQVARSSALRERVAHQLLDAYLFSVGSFDIARTSQIKDSLGLHTTPAERAKIARWVREKHEGFSIQEIGPLLITLESDELNDVDFERLCKESEQIASWVGRLLAQKKIDEADNEARHAPVNQLDDIVQEYIKNGLEAEAERWVSSRISEIDSLTLLRWMMTRYEDRKEYQHALPIVEKVFQLELSVAAYNDARRVAEAMQSWPTTHDALIEYARIHASAESFAQILVADENLDQALLLAEQAEHFEHWPLEIAKKAEKKFSERVITLYQKRIDSWIQSRHRSNYAEAARLARRVCSLYEQMGQPDSGTTYIVQLRQTHKRLPALQEELTSAGLPKIK